MKGQGLTPFRQFLIKIHSRCNLSCDYCYVYFAADRSWRGQPPVMEVDTARQAADRIHEHLLEHRLPQVDVILHGGEPLLAGPERLDAVLTVLRERLEPLVRLRLSLQTNGVLLDRRLLDLLLGHGVGVGVSLDGGPRAHDRHRRFANGRGSHAETLRGLRLLREPPYRRCYEGLLCTVDLRNDPVAAYEALLRHAPPALDFLLPHGTWDEPPPGVGHRTVPPRLPPGSARGAPPGPAPYAEWLGAVFDRWFDAPVQETRVRLFEELMTGLLGGTMRSEAVGLSPVDLVVVETDGSIQQSDSLKAAHAGAPATGLDVFRHSFDEAARTEAFRRQQRGLAGLGPTCRSCALVDVCGGGLYAHRYREGAGFAGPSVYCADLAALITHVRRRLQDHVDALGKASARSRPRSVPAVEPT